MNMLSQSNNEICQPGQKRTTFLRSIAGWFDNSKVESRIEQSASDEKIDWLRASPFLFIHLAVISVFWVGISPIAIWTAIGLYLLRMFAITGFYHRYFSHKNFKTGRIVQFVFAIIGASAAQRGPLWWAAHHRHHHRVSDQDSDPHSPSKRGFLWSHCLWFLSNGNFSTRNERIKDLLKFPELRWLDKYDGFPPVFLAIVLFLTGAWLENAAPELGTNGIQLMIWGFFVSTVALYHATYTINSLAHRFGKRRFETKDDSRNNWLLAIITLGEGWHNNHHFYCGTVRQGFKWWEIDLTFYGLKLMSFFGLVSALKPIPEKIIKVMEMQPVRSPH